MMPLPSQHQFAPSGLVIDTAALIHHYSLYLAEHWVCPRALRVPYVSLNLHQRLVRPLSLPTFECPPPHLLEAFTDPPPTPEPIMIKVSLIECDGEELCLLPVSLTLENCQAF